MEVEAKSERIELRATIRTKELLQRAAMSTHKSMSEFLLDAGLAMASETLADRRTFALEGTDWQAFQDALDRPVTDKPRLRKLLTEPGVLD